MRQIYQVYEIICRNCKRPVWPCIVPEGRQPVLPPKCFRCGGTTFDAEKKAA